MCETCIRWLHQIPGLDKNNPNHEELVRMSIIRKSPNIAFLSEAVTIVDLIFKIMEEINKGMKL